ncbi:aminoglycoside phosphotransferase [Streptomyces canus]
MNRMTATAPPATGVRTPWENLPESVRAAVADVLGEPVAHAVTQSGGFSPGAATRVRTATGRRAFVKAVSGDTNPDSPELHRTEARNAAALPAAVPAPRLLGTYDDGTWVALVHEDVPGRQPHIPWHRAELERVLDAVADLGRTLTPSPLDAPPAATALARTFSGWQRLLHGENLSAQLDPWAATQLPRLAELARPLARGRHR